VFTACGIMHPRCCRPVDWKRSNSVSSGFGGLEDGCWPLVHKFAGSNEAIGIFRAKKITSTPSFGGEVKPAVPCRRFTACKRPLNVTWKSGSSRTWRHLAATVGTSRKQGVQ
jgi:hypothetical protein